MRIVAAVLLFASVAAQAASPLPQVFSCGTQGTVGGLGTGVDLARYVVDITRYPEAICNDGTPAIFYYGAATKAADRDKWIIFLQGGGSCVDGQTCAQRWCSVDTNYGMDKMTTSLSKPMIRGVGFMSPDAENQFGSWNRVLLFYCSSDTWTGNATRTLAASAGGQTRDYEIHFRGRPIIDAVLDTLRNAGSATPTKRRAVRHNATTAWPDLDSAQLVLFAGASAGGAGARANLDRVAAKLRATNPGLDVRGIFDAFYSPLAEESDFTKTVYCANDPARGCSYEAFTKSVRENLNSGLYGASDDESCLAWHAALPGTEWRCSDGEHVNFHHLSTPFFIHQDLQDESVGGGWVEAGFGTASDYANRVEDEMRNMPVPEEPRAFTPGLFIPQCTDHESFTNDDAVFRVKIGGLSWHDAVWNWVTGASPQQLIRHYTGTPGKAPECP